MILPKRECKPKYTFDADYGHYGGYFVKIPKRDLPCIKKQFGNTFPRRTTSLTKHETDAVWVHFAERSKGIDQLEKFKSWGVIKLNLPEMDD